MSISLKQIDEAKALLKSSGFCTELLWSIYDVRQSHHCTFEEAHVVLNRALKQHHVMAAIFEAIEAEADALNLKRIEQ